MTETLTLPALKAAIIARPWTGVAIACAAGAGLALVDPRGRLMRAATSALGGFLVAIVREIARDQVVIARVTTDTIS